MTMIFERDENGLLHQVNMTVDDVAAAGRNMTLMGVQQWYVLLTPNEEKILKDQREAAQAEMKRIKDEEDARKAKIAADKDILAQQEAAVKQAEQEQARAKDEALALALSKLADLEKKVAGLKGVS